MLRECRHCAFRSAGGRELVRVQVGEQTFERWRRGSDFVHESLVQPHRTSVPDIA